MTQKWFESRYGKSLKIAPPSVQSFSATNDSSYYFGETFQITPLWEFSKISSYLQSQPVVLVPVQPIRFLDAKNQQYALVFARDSNNQITSRLQVYEAYEDYKLTHSTINVNDFSGTMFQIGLNGKIERIYGLVDGQFRYRKILSPNQNLFRIYASPRSCDDLRRNTNPNEIQLFLLRICNLFGDQGPYDNAVTVPISLGWNVSSGGGSGGSGFDLGGYGGGTGGGNTTYVELSNEIDGTLFDIAGETTKFQAFMTEYMQELHFNEFEFLRLYSNKRLFTAVDYYLRSRGFNNTVALAIKNNMSFTSNPDAFINYLRLLTTDLTFFTIQSQAGFLSETVTTVGNYINAGFTRQEFSELYANQDTYNEVNNILNGIGFSSITSQNLIDKVWTKIMLDENVSDLNAQERVLALLNRAEFMLYALASRVAIAATRERFNGNVGVGDDRNIANAFQHSYWNAMLARGIGRDRAKVWTDAHESVGYTPFATDMDFFNNEVGRRLGIEFQPNNNITFPDFIMQNINNGMMQYVCFDGVDANGQFINQRLRFTNQTCP
jgi:hypothetical protein